MRKEIVGGAIQGAPWLRWGILEHSKSNFGRHVVEDGSIIVEIQPNYVRVITADMAGFQLWPRYGNIIGLTVESTTATGDPVELKVTEYGGTYIGENGSSIIYDRSPYPMTFDAVRGTFVAQISKEDNPDIRTTEVLFNGGFMANCFWTDGVERVLNWRGTPNRHFTSDSRYNIPGVSNGATTFGTWIYEGGEQLIEAPDGAFVTGAFYKDKILYCISVLNNKERVHIFNDNEWILQGEREGGSVNIPCFISPDGSRFISGDGVPCSIFEDNIVWTESLLNSSGTCSHTWGETSNILVENGVQTIWAELDDSVTVTTSVRSESIFDSGGASTSKTVPVKLLGNLADYVRVILEADTSVYVAIYGAEPPEGINIFSARAEPNGRFCFINWSAMSVNGCVGPNSFKVSSDGTAVAGEYSPNVCSQGANFYMLATLDTGVVGRSNNLFPNLDCSTDTSKHIISLGNWRFGYTGQIEGTGDPTWSVNGGTIIGPDNQSTVEIEPDSCSTSITISVTGMCGTATTTLTLPALLTVSVSGDRNASVGDTYSLTNGIGDVSWSFSGGTINSSGTITAITGCGSATITGTDSCGSSASYCVKLSTGIWVEINYESCACTLYGSTCEISDVIEHTPPLTTYNDETCSIQKITGTIVCVNTAHPDCAVCPTANTSQVVPGACSAWFDCGGTNPRWLGKTTHEWQCP